MARATNAIGTFRKRACPNNKEMAEKRLFQRMDRLKSKFKSKESSRVKKGAMRAQDLTYRSVKK
jgi:hypothetical protein